MTDSEGAIHTDAPDATDSHRVEPFDAEAAFLEMLEDAPKRKRKEPSAGQAEATETDPEEPSSEDGHEEDTEEPEADDDEHEETEEEADEAEPQDPDEQEVVVKVDGEERKVPIKDLKRLFGQEQALTRKSMEVAEARKVADTKAERAEVALKKMLENAEARLKPYKDIDWALLPMQVDQETYKRLKADALEVHQDVRFLTQELDATVTARQDAITESMKAAAMEAHKVLNDPTTGIPNWSPETYNSIMAFAVEMGLSEANARALVDPAAIKIIHRAMLYERAQKAVAEKVKPIARATAKRVLKPGQGGSTARADDAMTRLRKSGSVEDAENVFLAMLRD